MGAATILSSMVLTQDWKGSEPPRAKLLLKQLNGGNAERSLTLVGSFCRRVRGARSELVCHPTSLVLNEGVCWGSL